jgi:DNA-binding transcriptional LysR family regulator
MIQHHTLRLAASSNNSQQVPIGRGMDLRRQRYFMAVVENSGFRRAAIALNVSQPALSQQILQLEQDLRLNLFERDRRTVKLTPAGEEYYRGLTVVMAELDQCIRLAHDAQAGRVGVLRIGANQINMLSTLPSLFDAFRKANPTASLQIVPVAATEVVAALRDNRVDVVFTGHNPDDEEIESEVICSFEWRVLLHRDAPQAQKGEIALASLSGETMLIPSHYQYLRGYANLLEICRAHKLQPGQIQEISGANPSLTVIGMVACGVGFAIVSSGNECIHVPGVLFKRIAGLDNTKNVRLTACWRRGETKPLAQDLLRVCREFSASAPTASKQ